MFFMVANLPYRRLAGKSYLLFHFPINAAHFLLKPYRNAGSLARFFFNPLRPNNDLSQTSHCNIKGVSVSEVMRIENMINQVKFS